MTIKRQAPAEGQRPPYVARRRAGYAAFGWVLVFLAWHVVWLATGLAAPTSSHFHGAALVTYRVVTSFIDVMIVLGCILPLALVQQWGRRLPRSALLTAAWIATALLTARGVSGLLDDLLRAIGFHHGLTGLTVEQTTATARVTLWVQASGYATDVLFTAGAVVFACAAVEYARRTRPKKSR